MLDEPMSKCNHVVRLRAAGEQFNDSNVIVMRIVVYCERCDTVFRALGVRDGVSADCPGLTDDRESVMFPLVPMGEEPETLCAGMC